MRFCAYSMVVRKYKTRIVILSEDYMILSNNRRALLYHLSDVINVEGRVSINTKLKISFATRAYGLVRE